MHLVGRCANFLDSKMTNDIERKQKDICKKYGARFQPCDLSLKIGISENVKSGAYPIHGVRVKEEAGTSGWYIWTGQWSDDPDFFLPLHGYHVQNWSELVLPYLGLAEGWRFLIAPDHEDVWEDPKILE